MLFRRVRTALAITLLLTSVWGCDVRRGNEAEPPPQGWGALGLKPGWTVQQAASAAEANRLCRALGVSAADTWNTRSIASCAVPSQQTVILSKPEDAPHEFTHSWGLVHHDGRGWFNPDGSLAKPLPPGAAQMLLSMARATPPSEIANAQPKRMFGAR